MSKQENITTSMSNHMVIINKNFINLFFVN